MKIEVKSREMTGECGEQEFCVEIRNEVNFFSIDDLTLS